MHSAQSKSSVGLSSGAGVDDIQVAADNGAVHCVLPVEGQKALVPVWALARAF